MQKPPLTTFVAGVIIVLAILVALTWFIKGKAGATKAAIFAFGYLIGMLAMYIAIHFYSHK